MLSSMQAHDHSVQEKNRQNRNPAQTTITGKSMIQFQFVHLKTWILWVTKKLFVSNIDGDISSQTNCTQMRLDVSNVNCSMSAQPTTSPERMIQSPSHALSNGALHTINQPYLGDSSNFGAFYHHHGQHHHLPSYGNPYDKYKSVHHTRSPNASPYDPYQSFYSANAHHHHQMVRPNGYIDLVPR